MCIMNFKRFLVAVVAALSCAAALAQKPNDPLYASKGSWKQKYDDQWGLKAIGFLPTGSGKSAWDVETGAGKPVIVAVIERRNTSSTRIARVPPMSTLFCTRSIAWSM